ncbi:hypothetical protein COCON_G00226880 [Conger conger]|uniref:Urokinase-type plasminogen activator n=1 Tax=Conger conger TaxID=82655 RepID=A0A9Q1CX57_CONCO|nr:hypothetical protein COCON_G00226880 [Conger conger]
MKSLLSLLLVVAAASGLQMDPKSHYSLRSGSRCRNGGTLRRGFCDCPPGFSGKKCEIDQSEECFSGDGRDYRGTAAQSESGQRCLGWNYVRIVHRLRPVVQDGGNYCRNPGQSDRPWCWVRSGRKITKEFCKIPRCEEELTPESCGERRQKRFKVVGGTVTTVETQPWIASIFHKVRAAKRPVFRCGGTLIAPCWVLSAAHCFPDGAATSVSRLSVVLGNNALNETDLQREQHFQVHRLIVHEEFDNKDQSFNNDIALLEIRSSSGKCAVRSESVRTACLPPEHRMLPPGAVCDVAGYGKEGEHLWYISQYLRQAQVELVAQSVCTDKDYYGGLVTDNMFCAASPDWSKDACKSDSGGPLVCEVDGRMFLFGIVSWGHGCAMAFRPGVYTRVTNYNRWIRKSTGLSAITAGSMYPQK